MENEEIKKKKIGRPKGSGKSKLHPELVAKPYTIAVCDHERKAVREFIDYLRARRDDYRAMIMKQKGDVPR